MSRIQNMVLQTSGPISLANIATEFGGTVPHSLSEYYSASTQIPASGILKFSDFYGASAINFNVGTGADGDVTLTSGETVTLTKDMNYNSLTIPANTYLKTNGYRVLVKTILNLTNASASCIQNKGSDGGTYPFGGSGTGAPTGTLQGGQTGGYDNEINFLTGQAATRSPGSFGSTSGGTGGNAGFSYCLGANSDYTVFYYGATTTGGTGGSRTYVTPTDTVLTNLASTMKGGCGGAGGGFMRHYNENKFYAPCGPSTQVWGAGTGGGGGGVMWVSASTIQMGSNNLSYFDVRGGIGGNGRNVTEPVCLFDVRYNYAPAAGGGGGGGSACIAYGSKTGTGSVNASGGSAGTQGSVPYSLQTNTTGGSGQPGSSGTIMQASSAHPFSYSTAGVVELK